MQGNYKCKKDGQLACVRNAGKRVMRRGGLVMPPMGAQKELWRDGICKKREVRIEIGREFKDGGITDFENAIEIAISKIQTRK